MREIESSSSDDFGQVHSSFLYVLNLKVQKKQVFW